MEAIAALIGALFEALATLVVACLELLATLVSILLEFVFLAITQGVSAASARYRERTNERATRSLNGNTATPDTATPDTATPDTAATTRGNLPLTGTEDCENQEAAGGENIAGRETNVSQPQAAGTARTSQSKIIVTLILVMVVASVAGWKIRDRIRKRRVEKTYQQVQRIAAAYSAQVHDVEQDVPRPGMLTERDAWGHSLELFVDEMLLGTLIVVRSTGPDGKEGSIDDILATHLIPARAKDVGGELVKRGVNAVRDRVKRMIPGGDREKPRE